MPSISIFGASDELWKQVRIGKCPLKLRDEAVKLSIEIRDILCGNPSITESVQQLRNGSSSFSEQRQLPRSLFAICITLDHYGQFPKARELLQFVRCDTLFEEALLMQPLVTFEERSLLKDWIWVLTCYGQALYRDHRLEESFDVVSINDAKPILSAAKILLGEEYDELTLAFVKLLESRVDRGVALKNAEIHVVEKLNQACKVFRDYEHPLFWGKATLDLALAEYCAHNYERATIHLEQLKNSPEFHDDAYWECSYRITKSRILGKTKEGLADSFSRLLEVWAP
ncbi:MAG: hypothetical protein HYZ37_11935 [Candidatus Solibacter usitatus]|nr:hypothetical protein [Candidatus Solibacter usitatus]